MTAPDAVVSIDGGKSELRLLVSAGERRQYGIGPGMVYLAGEDGVDRIVDAVREAAASVDLPAQVTGVVAGLTGVPGTAGDRRRLARRLEAVLHGPVVVVEDVYLAHAGALNGPGTVLSVGTGTNVLAVGAAGGCTRLDGWGPLLGDRGSGYAIGLAGLRAATAALDGVGRPTALADAFLEHVGGADLASLQRFYRDAQVVARVAGFARIVVDAAARDDVAAEICQAAVDDLVALAAAAAARQPGAGHRVSYSGRVIGTDGFLHDRLRAGLRTHGLDLVEPAGSTVEGGPALLASSGPYASVVDRLRRDVADDSGAGEPE